MSELPSRSRFPAESPANFCSLPFGKIDKNPRRRRRFRSPAFTGGGGSGRRRTPVTPLLQWKFDETADLSNESVRKQREAAGERPVVSARKLASLIRDLRIQKAGGGGKTNLDLESNGNVLHRPYSSHANCFNLCTDTKKESCSLLALKNHKGCPSGQNQLEEDYASLLHSSVEKATKWDSKLSKDTFDLYGSLRLLEDQQSNTVSIISFLQSELEFARSRVSELEAERGSAKKQLDCFVRRIEDQKTAWKRREYEKIESVIDAMKKDLSKEMKCRKRLEFVNAKLVNELTEVKLSAKQMLGEFENETKARELMEEVCNELAMEIGDDKAEVEALKIECLKNKQEVEEERKMLQMAEVWREERVQMKLIDAKLALEEKYSQLSKLQDEIETFLRSKNGNKFDVSEINQAEALKEAVGSVEADDIEELSYQPPPASQDIFSIFEELRSRENVNEKEIEQCYGPSKNSTSRRNDDEEDDSGWETASHVEEEEEQGSSKSPDRSESSVNGAYLQNSEINELFPANTTHSKKKGSSISRLWKSSRSSNAEDFKKITFEFTNGRLCNGRLSNATLSPARKSGDTGSPPSVRNWSSPDLLNPNIITKEAKGRGHWPQGSKKQSLKAKLMEARFQSQKVQLRQILEQQI